MGGQKHRVMFRKLGRDSAHRMAMLRNLVDSLILSERVKTTLPKAKEVRRFADHVINIAKKGDDAQRRAQVRSVLMTSQAQDKVFDELAKRYEHRPGGVTRVLKIGWRKGDGADMAVIELVDTPLELRPAKPVNANTVLRSKGVETPTYAAMLPSRNKDLTR
ncbi:50S ribosomal protein L17 [Hondaea fermentalgiana]|uniref:50S ribosomal protein L17 n=1 Tax=Hondaea fermentalgiana TaxID=2315210 RepID=A0A2R5GG79_9STRA|nr:50S ribosomal protein L17 [Hondaea fermentalgiana]|eukprot:GBG29880.1 50S ribosomal protein L17 [Hondaea fermentalgiana]